MIALALSDSNLVFHWLSEDPEIALNMCSMPVSYTLLYMTFMQAKDNGLNILKGEKSYPVIYWNFSVRDKNGKKIPFDVYKNLDKNEQQEYKVTPFLKTYNVLDVYKRQPLYKPQP